MSPLVVTSYGDSVVAAFAAREGRWPEAGEVLRLRPGVYLQAVGGPLRAAVSPSLEFGARDDLLLAIEKTYSGDWNALGLLVEALVDPDIRWRRAAFDALRYAAQRSFGYDPEAEGEARVEAQKRWTSWVQRHAKRDAGER